MKKLRIKPGLMFLWPCSRYKDREAIVFKNSRLTFLEMDALINRIANGLLSIGLTTGHKVAILMNNSIESAACVFAIPRAGLVYVSLNTRHSANEDLQILKDAEIDAIILHEAYISVLESVFPLVPTLKHTIIVGKSQSDRMTFSEVIDGQPETIPDVTIDEDNDIARIQYTSGTTGRPKGVVWTFRIYDNILTSVLINMEQPINSSVVNLCSGPLTHAAGLFMMACYSRGAANIILPKFDVEEVLKSIECEHVTSILLIPTMLYRVLQTPNLKSYNLSSIKEIWYGTAPISVDYLKLGLQVFGNVFRQNYGMSEIPQPITYLGLDDHNIKGSETQIERLSSAGRPAWGLRLKLLTIMARKSGQVRLVRSWSVQTS